MSEGGVRVIGPRIAPAGTVWVCGACGKKHGDQYGIEGEGSYGWDESCMLNAVLCHDNGILPWKPLTVAEVLEASRSASEVKS